MRKKIGTDVKDALLRVEAARDNVRNLSAHFDPEAMGDSEDDLSTAVAELRDAERDYARAVK